MLETDIDLNDAWMIPFQLHAARLTGLVDRSVVALGLVAEAPNLGGHEWIRTAEELDQPIRLVVDFPRTVRQPCRVVG